MCDNLIITLMSFMMCAYLENVPCDWVHVTGSCEGIAGALPRVFKLGQASCSSVVLKSYIPTRPVSFGVVDRSALWWQRILVAPGLEGVCVVCVFCVEGQQQRKFPHIWWQRWDPGISKPLEDTHRNERKKKSQDRP